MVPGIKKQIDIARLRADVVAAGVELLSAQCATDRIRLQYSMQDIIEFAERRALRRAVASAEAMHRYFSQIGAQIAHEEGTKQ
jgi:hypothetical protein